MSSPESARLPPFLAACRREPVPHTPVWIMRQAGRYLPEYRRVREGVDFLTMCRTPDLAAEVTLQPLRRFELDAAILFSDIMIGVQGLGIEVEFSPGPVVASPVRSTEAVAELPSKDPAEYAPFVMETIQILRKELPATVPLIGFAGAPFTLFCYLVEGGGSKTFIEARSFLTSQPDASRLLLDKVADAQIAYLTAQAEAGAQALMLFDSWVGLLGPVQFRTFAQPAVVKIMEALLPLGLPLIYFPNQGSTLLEDVADIPADVIGIDWRLPLSRAKRILGSEKTVQGNLDPAALFSPAEELKREIDTVLREAGPGPGHIFNLGHGIERKTDPDTVKILVDHVHERTAGI